jgi:hypothetical protein
MTVKMAASHLESNRQATNQSKTYLGMSCFTFSACGVVVEPATLGPPGPTLEQLSTVDMGHG